MCVAVALRPRTTPGPALDPALLPTPAPGPHPVAAQSSGGCRWARCAPRAATCRGAIAAGTCVPGNSPACRPLACCSERLLDDHPLLGSCMGGLIKLPASPLQPPRSSRCAGLRMWWHWSTSCLPHTQMWLPTWPQRQRMWWSRSRWGWMPFRRTLCAAWPAAEPAVAGALAGCRTVAAGRGRKAGQLAELWNLLEQSASDV